MVMSFKFAIRANNDYICCFVLKRLKNIKNQILLMNKNNSMNLEGLSYVAPSVTVLDVQAEGVLCQSGKFGIADWETDEDSLTF